jgi:hypothetical protein
MWQTCLRDCWSAKRPRTKTPGAVYLDRLDGKITEEFWKAKSAESQEEPAILASLRELEQAENPERALDRVRI